MQLTNKEMAVLHEISEWAGSYPWNPKTTAKLVEKGLVAMVDNGYGVKNYAQLTAEGKAVLR